MKKNINIDNYPTTEAYLDDLLKSTNQLIADFDKPITDEEYNSETFQLALKAVRMIKVREEFKKLKNN